MTRTLPPAGSGREPLAQHLEDCRVRIPDRIVALDHVIVRFAKEDLRIAGIGEPVLVASAAPRCRARG